VATLEGARFITITIMGIIIAKIATAWFILKSKFMD
jgi:hypothetical protein